MKAKATKRTSRVVCDGDPFYVIEFTNASGSLSYRVSGMKDGKQVRQNFKTEAEAVARKQALEAEVDGIESSIRPHRTRLTDEQLRQAEHAYANIAWRAPLC